MLKKIIITNLFLLLLNFTTSIAKDLSCETFSGEWNGNKKGAGYRGDLKIVHLCSSFFTFNPEAIDKGDFVVGWNY